MKEYQNIKIFLQKAVSTWSEKRFVIKKVKNTLSWTYFISEFNEEEIVGTFSKKVLQKTNQREFRVEKVIEKADKLYVKLKDRNNYFHSWIDTKEIV